MTDARTIAAEWSRRRFLGGTATLGVLPLLSFHNAMRGSPNDPAVITRDQWGSDLPPRGAIGVERPGDLRFLLVHHTETPNGYAASSVPRQLQSIYRYHTTTKGWPDVAYNFFVDTFGRVWEGRTGSLSSPAKGDATGGSQGFAMLCCFLGDHVVVPPSPAAINAMASLLGWLAERYVIDLSAGPTIEFVSRGSNRWPAGTTVRTDPIAGHRDMSMTACPGDAAYPMVRGVLLDRAKAAVVDHSPIARPPTPSSIASTTPPATTPTTAAAPRRSTPSSDPVRPLPTVAPSRPIARSLPRSGSANQRPPVAPIVAAVIGSAALIGGSLIAVRRRQRRSAEPDFWIEFDDRLGDDSCEADAQRD